MRCICLTIVCLSVIHTAGRSVADETPERQAAAVKAISGIASNVQKNRDGTVRFVRFSKPIVTNEHVAEIAAFEQLDYLAVVTPDVDDAGLACVGSLKNLDTLFLSGSGITDVTLARIADLPKLQHLYLDGTHITDAGLQHLSTLPALKTLSLADTQTGNKGLAAVGRISPLEVLRLSNLQVTDDGLSHLAGLNSLQQLSLDGCSIQGATLGELASLKLRSLDLRQTDVGPEVVATLAAWSDLEHVDLRDTSLCKSDISSLQRSGLNVTLTPVGQSSENAWQRYLAGKPLATAETSAETDPAISGLSPPPAAADTSVTTEVMDAVARVLQHGQSPSFQKHVVPLLGRLGCNGRTCHGSFQGKGGFSLSMFGHDFKADHAALTSGTEPRVDTADPLRSLILNKPTSENDHGGGQRFATDGWEYSLLKQWIENGAQGVADAPAKLLALEVTPTQLVFEKPGQIRQLRCVAVWEDGVREDVTRLARFQTNDDTVATVSEDGLVTCGSAGDTWIISFYDNGLAATQVIRPVSAETAAEYPVVDTPTQIDRLVVQKLRLLGIVPSPVCSDHEFLRRVSLDLAGTLPSAAEVTAFQNDTSPDKRDRKVDELLNSDAYATWWAMKLADLTGSNAQSLGSTDMNTPAADYWNAWLKRRVKDNIGWDRIAAGIILASSRRPGQTYASYAAEQSLHLKRSGGTDFTDPENPMHYYWFRSNNQTDADRALTFGYTFMGVRLQCAQCHKHPFDQWSKDDFEKFSAFFRRVRTGVAPDGRAAQHFLKTKLGVPEKLDTAALRRQMYLRVSAEGLPIPWNEVWIEPPTETRLLGKIPGGNEFDLNEFVDPREPLVEWLMQDDNPYFAPAFVNRVWAHYFGVGLVDPPDDLNMANPPGNRPLLTWLSDQFVAHDFDLKWLHRTIVTSHAYQRSSATSPGNQADRRNFSHALIRRMPAEVMIDAILRATAREDQAAGYLTDCRQRKIGQHPKSYQARGIDYSLLVFGKPRRTTSCDCERQDQPTLLQSLYVRNDAEMIGWLERADGWLQSVAQQLSQPLSSEATAPADPAAPAALTAEPEPGSQVDTELIHDLIGQAWLRTLSRDPSPHELEISTQHIRQAENTVEGLRDLMWALLNSHEFMTNH
ncbi:MAG: DUF1549 domain-containing protein [Fuerstiella sp.]